MPPLGWPKPIRSGAPRPRISSPSCCGREHWSCGTIRRGHSAPIANSWCTRPPSARVSGRSTPTTPRTSTASMGKRPRQPVVGGTRVGAETPRAIHLAHSPDADDAFMFWALAAGRIDTAGRRYIHELADIESLNRRALQGELDVTAVVFHVYTSHCEGSTPLGPRAGFCDRYPPPHVPPPPPPGRAPASPAQAHLNVADPT